MLYSDSYLQLSTRSSGPTCGKCLWNFFWRDLLGCLPSVVSTAFWEARTDGAEPDRGFTACLEPKKNRCKWKNKCSWQSLVYKLVLLWDIHWPTKWECRFSRILERVDNSGTDIAFGQVCKGVRDCVRRPVTCWNYILKRTVSRPWMKEGKVKSAVDWLRLLTVCVA